jgi:hypothetical protein
LPCYNIDFGLFNEKTSTIAEGIKDKQEAEWLIAQMGAARGL